jgi:hypothetical protein
MSRRLYVTILFAMALAVSIAVDVVCYQAGQLAANLHEATAAAADLVQR